ncbi:MAG: hypothetical protein EBV06_16955 [Planctomycetia bacterium]|nr:hypothetical protein [Planctomycetia bacterium]
MGDETKPGTTPPAAPAPLEQYRVLMAYHATERQVFVARMQLFLIASTALFGFVSTQKLPPLFSEAPWDQIISVLLGCTAGLVIWWFWGQARAAGKWHINNFLDGILLHERAALGDVMVFRRAKPKRALELKAITKEECEQLLAQTDNRPRADRVWAALIWSFLGLWIIVVVWIVVACVLNFIRVPVQPAQAPQSTFSGERVAIVVLFIALVSLALWVRKLSRRLLKCA